MVSNSFKILLCSLPFLGVSWTWLLTQCGLNESYRVLHLSTHFARVFLSITVESKTFPTLVETQWPDGHLPSFTLIYPQPHSHASGIHDDCSLIQQTIWSQVDSISRLWVMDMGYSNASDEHKCNPKLLVFDLIRNNVQVLHIDCGKYIQPGDDGPLDIELGPRVDPCGSEKFIYFILAHDAHLLAYDLLEQKWHYKQLTSKKYCVISEFLPIRPRDIAFGRQGEILISDEDGQLYAASNLFHNATRISSPDPIEMTLLGTLLGPTRGLMVDPYGVLFYVVTKFGAVVRCEYRQNMTAEDSEIIHLTSKNIQQIFFGHEGGSVWLLSDRWLKPSDQCISGY